MYLTAGSNIETVTGAFDTVGTAVTEVFEMIVGNPVLLVFTAAGLLAVGVHVFKIIKGAAR